MQAQTLDGALVLELQPAYVSNVETFPLTIPSLNGASATDTLTIRPQAGATALSITSADTTAATVDLNGAQFVTIDGRPGGTGSNPGSGGGTASQLTIANTSTTGVALRFINEASTNTIRYITLQGVNTSATGGTVVFSTTTGANGNDNNTIDHCDIREGASTPANGIYALGSTGTTAQNNSGNTVANCNVFNFHSTSSDAAGVRLDGGNTFWNIVGNSYYQTAVRALSSGFVRPIYINSTSGTQFIVTGNFIGGSAPNADGSPWTTAGTTGLNAFEGIRVTVISGSVGSVQGNTIRNIVWKSSDTLPNDSPWTGIYFNTGSVDNGTLMGNTIGSGTGTSSISVTTSISEGTTFGIRVSTRGHGTLVNNTIGSITTNATDTNHSASLIGIQVFAHTVTIADNTVGSTTTPNSLNAVTSSGVTSSPQQVTGIENSSEVATISGNTVANLNNNYAGTSARGQIRGIMTTTFGDNTVTGNTIRNLSTTSRSTGSATTASILGISVRSSALSPTVSKNVVHSLSNTAASAPVVITGISCSGGASNAMKVIAGNLVHSLFIASTSSSSLLYGIAFYGGIFTAKNNVVRVGLDASGANTAGASLIRGIYDSAGTEGRNFHHNSVYVGGTQTSGASSTYAFLSTSVSNTRDFRNNIFVNARSNSGGIGKHYAVVYGGSGASPSGLTAGGNLFLASGTGGVLGNYGSDLTTLVAWQAATGQDATSLNTDPLFINPTGDAATVDLHIPANSPANHAGVAVGVTDDFDGDARSLVTPTIGADELFLPNIYVEQPAGTVLGDGVSVKDFGGVLANGGNGAAVFKITNTGTAPLTGLAVTLDGADAGDFGITQPGSTALAPGASAFFNGSFTPTVLAARAAAIHIASNVVGAKNPFDIALAGTGQTVFGVWAIANGVSTDPSANGGANVPAFAFGMVPGASGALVFNGSLGAGGTIGANGLPAAWLEMAGGGTDVRALFVRRKNAAAAGLTYGVAFSAALSTWNTSADVPAVLADDGMYQIVSVPFPAPFVAGGLGYFRVSVTLAP